MNNETLEAKFSRAAMQNQIQQMTEDQAKAALLQAYDLIDRLYRMAESQRVRSGLPEVIREGDRA